MQSLAVVRRSFRSFTLLMALLLAGVFAPVGARAQTAGTSYLAAGGVLMPGQYITSASKQLFAIMQWDKNFCVYRGSGPAAQGALIWCSGSDNARPTGGLFAQALSNQFFATMQTNGQFCVNSGFPNSSATMLWCANAATGNGPYYLALQENQALAVFDGAAPGSKSVRWSSIPALTAFTASVSGTGTVSAPAVAGGTGAVSCGATCTQSYPWTATVAIAAVPGGGQRFTGWSGSCAGQGNPCSLWMGTDTKLTATATFVSGPKLTVASSREGGIQSADLVYGSNTRTIVGSNSISCGAGASNACSATFAPNAQVKLYSLPFTNRAFSAWTGACSGQSNPCTVTMSADADVAAIYAYYCNRTQCAATCTDLGSDPQNCGACGNVCSSGTQCKSGGCRCTDSSATLCGQTCKRLREDLNNCGACGNVCTNAGAVCREGACSCPTNAKLCGTECIVVMGLDENNCGDCGKVCAAGTYCNVGRCVK